MQLSPENEQIVRKILKNIVQVVALSVPMKENETDQEKNQADEKASILLNGCLMGAGISSDILERKEIHDRLLLIHLTNQKIGIKKSFELLGYDDLFNNVQNKEETK